MDLYQEIILDHSKRPHHAGLREPFDAEVHHINPTCGDECTLRVHLSGEGRSAVISDLSYDALGCAISTASASILADEVIGHTVEEALGSFAAMRILLPIMGADSGDADNNGARVAFPRAPNYPARVTSPCSGRRALPPAPALPPLRPRGLPPPGLTAFPPPAGRSPRAAPLPPRPHPHTRRWSRPSSKSAAAPRSST